MKSYAAAAKEKESLCLYNQQHEAYDLMIGHLQF